MKHRHLPIIFSAVGISTLLISLAFRPKVEESEPLRESAPTAPSSPTSPAVMAMDRLIVEEKNPEAKTLEQDLKEAYQRVAELREDLQEIDLLLEERHAAPESERATYRQRREELSEEWKALNQRIYELSTQANTELANDVLRRHGRKTL